MSSNEWLVFVCISPGWERIVRKYAECLIRWTRRFDKHFRADANGAPDYTREVKL
jgi:hypothetical protein